MSMTYEEAARILDPKTTREALNPYAESPVDRMRVVDEACTIAAELLRKCDQNATEMRLGCKTLTLERLREMDGQPVWIVEAPHWGHWELSEDAEDYIIDRHEEFYGLKYTDPEGKHGLHKLGWLAYAYPPARIDREAWTAEWVEYTGVDKGFHYCSECKQQAFNYDDDGEVVEVLSDFCPSCGKAMTPEAWAELEKRLRG